MEQGRVQDETRHVVAYILHDAEANVEGYITDYSLSSLQGAEDMGMIIVAEHNDGSRKIVKASEVVPPQPYLDGVKVVLPSYVDVRMDAVLHVLDALRAVVLPDVAVLSNDAETVIDDPAERFSDALMALKEIVGGEKQ